MKIESEIRYHLLTYIFPIGALFVTEDPHGTTTSKVDVLLELAKSLKKHQDGKGDKVDDILDLVNTISMTQKQMKGKDFRL